MGTSISGAEKIIFSHETALFLNGLSDVLMDDETVISAIKNMQHIKKKI